MSRRIGEEIKTMCIGVHISQHEYLKDMAWLNRVTMTEYVCRLIEKDKAEQTKKGIYPVR